MNGLFKYMGLASLVLSSELCLASPAYLITHNLTSVESNAYIAGHIPSPVPTKPNRTGMVHWLVVKIACFGHTTNNRCPALIKMETNSANPIELGMVTMDIDTGDISPKHLSANGYSFTVNGPGEATLSKN